MEFAKDEIDKFLALVQRRYRNAAREFLSFICSIKSADIALKDDKNKGKMFNSYVSIVYDDDFYQEGSSIMFFFRDAGDIVFSNETLKFIKSIIKRRLSGLSLTYTNDTKTLYFADRTSPCLIEDKLFRYESDIRIIVSDRLYGMSECDADFSDNIWHDLYSEKDLMAEMVKYYIEDPKLFSSKIQKRIQFYYDNLSDSDKLLLELGEDLA